MTRRNSTKGNIFEIQRFSVHDGPGIRTTVFMKGCPLKCLWCHNPEGISGSPEMAFVPGKCIGCGYCVHACRRGAHRIVEGTHAYDRRLCHACGACTEECYSGALTRIGREMTVDGVMDVVSRDAQFYETSGGGMTLSGGEPTYQPEFACGLLAAGRAAGIDCVIETCGYCRWEVLERMLPTVSLFLFDIKDTDEGRHERHTGVGPELIRENLQKLYKAGAKITLRCPILPGVNDCRDHFEGIASLAKEMPALAGIEIMPYHRLGESKISRFGFRGDNRILSVTPGNDTIDEWISRFAQLGVRVNVSGR